MRFCFWISFLFLTGMLGAQITPQQEKSIDSLFEKYNRKDAPGCVAGIVREGKVVFSKAYGLSNLDYSIPITPQTAFHLSTLSAQVTSACIGLMVLGNQVNLKDNVRKYIPELPDFGDTIRISHLLYHTSGLRDYYALMELTGADDNGYFDTDFVIKLLCQYKGLNNKPGEEFVYSRSNDVLLGEIVRRVSGIPLAAYAKVHLFDPLEMTHTFFNEDCHGVVPGRATGYKPDGTDHYEQFGLNDDAAGDHGLISTLEDFSKWDQNFYSKKVGGEGLHQFLLSRGTINNGTKTDYGFGMHSGTQEGQKIQFASGQTSGIRTHYLRFPETGLSVFVFCNREDGYPGTLCNELGMLIHSQARFYQQKHAEKPKLQTKLLESFTGVYRMKHSGFTQIVSLRNDTLRVRANPAGAEHNLLPMARHTFKREDANQIQLVFSTDVHGKRKLEYQSDGNKFEFFRVDSPPEKETDLKQFAGKYECPELQVTYLLLVVKEVLMAVRPGGETIQAMPGTKDELNARFDNLKFYRNASGQITGFYLDYDGRVNAARFEKK